MTNEMLTDLLRQVEDTSDAVPGLTRTRTSGLRETAEFVFGEAGWTVRVGLRNTLARGRGSRGIYAAQGDGETPEAAVASFVERLPFFVKASS